MRPRTTSRAAIRANTRLGARSLEARTQLGYARMLIKRGRARDRPHVLDLLDRAAATATALGTDALVNEAERLRELEAGTAVGAGPQGNAFRREGEYWTVVYEGSLVRSETPRGSAISRRCSPTRAEFHVVDLEAEQDRVSGSPSAQPERGRHRRGRGTAGSRRCRGDPRRNGQGRVPVSSRELRAEIEEAEASRPGAAAPARQELDFLATELARAVGLGGRDRRAASHAERARLNVTRAIKAAMRNLSRRTPRSDSTSRDDPHRPLLLLHARPAGRDRLGILTEPRRGLNSRSRGLNATADGCSIDRRRAVGVSDGSGDMVIRLGVRRVEPLAGTVVTEDGAERAFSGWMELIGAIAELIGGWPDRVPGPDRRTPPSPTRRAEPT